MADLLSAYNTQRSDIAGQASNRGAELRANTSSAKADLYEQNRAAADPSAAASAAAGSAAQLRLPYQGSPVANVFRDVLNRTAQGVTASAYGLPGLGAFYGGRPSDPTPTGTSTGTTTKNKPVSIVATS